MAVQEARHRQQRGDSMATVNVSLPRPLLTQIEASAAAKGLSRSAIIAQLCRSALETAPSDS